MPKFVRVATEGRTIDGREIKGEHLEQMATNYDPEKYGARIWLEHIRTYMPEGAFQAYGDVVALKTEKIDEKTVLLAELSPTEDLVKLNKKRQKIYTSVEITTNFSDTGEAYLTGIAITDSPASTGTEALKFNISNGKVDEAKLLSEYKEIASLEGEEDDQPEKGPSLLSKIQAMLGKKSDKSDDDFAQSEAAILHLTEVASTAQSDVKKLGADLKASNDAVVELTKSHEKLSDEFKALETKIKEEPVGTPRPELDGSNGAATDC
jgi:Phage capsid scaffolding protein (GPO) serine peptidase